MADRIKNRRIPHTWQQTDDRYDPELDGDDPQFARTVMTCSVCGEERRPGRDVAYMNHNIWGCWRRGGMPYQEGDLVIRGEYLDYFVRATPDGMGLTFNGSRSSLTPLAELRPHR